MKRLAIAAVLAVALVAVSQGSSALLVKPKRSPCQELHYPLPKRRCVCCANETPRVESHDGVQRGGS